VSSALVSLGVYNLNGIADSKVRPDPQRALQMFQFAATTFGDANAQYNLARMHLDGAGVDKDGREAIRWLFLAADKGHLQAEALLILRCRNTNVPISIHAGLDKAAPVNATTGRPSLKISLREG
jgi:TPR repeat protein